ncbi:MAG: hypothetical protein PUA88_04050 [Bacillales bacterium]|nr:hypothetical protein [Bacillales bacterium]
MSKIKCNETNCKHNSHQHCTKNMIKVNDIPKCESYEGVRDEKLVDTTLLEEYGDESDMSSIDEHMIECDCTRCVSNYSSYCTNPGILIVRKNKCAYCSSFKNR